MKTIRMILILLLLSGFDSSKNINTESLINDVVNLYQSHKSIAFSVEFKAKYLSDDDTISRSAECMIIRDIIDSTDNSIIWYNSDIGREVFSMSNKTYTIGHSQKKIYELTGDKHKDNYRGNVADKVTDIYFLKPESLKELLKDTANVISLDEDLIDSINYWKLTIKYPDVNELSDLQKNIWIEKHTNIIGMIDFKVKFQGNYQYDNWKLKNVEFDNINFNEKQKRLDSLLNLYEVINRLEFVKKSREKNKILEKGKEAIKFSGYYYQENKDIQSSDFKGKIILLDFWYTSCYPCIKAIPGINNLYNKYKDKGFVALGINSKDDYKNEKRLKKFLEHNKMDYPIIFVNNSVDSSYHVRGYPTFYLINQEGKIIYSQVGFAESEIDSLEILIKENLK